MSDDFLARIAQERDERVHDVHLDLPIPSWGDSLVGRFRVVSRKEIEKFAGRKASLETDMDLVIKATVELYAHDPEHSVKGTRMDENEDYVRIEDSEGLPVTWTTVLAEKLGKADLTSGRMVLNYCFRENGIAVAGFALKLFRWMQNTDVEVAEAISGE